MEKQAKLAEQTTTEAGGDLLEEVVAETKARSIYDHPAEMFPEIQRLGEWLAASGMFGVRNKEQGYVVAMTCFEERITPLEFRRRYHIIEGSPSKRADRMHADFLARGGEVNWIEYTSDHCKAMFLHQDHAPKGVVIEVTLKEMQDKGITRGAKGEKDNWRKWPRQMLKARVLSEGIRQVDPGCVAGEYTPEEISDFEPADIPTDKGTAPRASSKPAPVPPEPAQEAEPDPAAKHRERCEKAVGAFSIYTLTQEDLEAHVGDYENGVLVEAKDWGEAEFDILGKTLKEIKATAPEERTAAICRLFNLPTSAMEG